ncbi:neurotrophin-3 isoform X2 [Paramormyrops kingsleyae]|uniref:Neurotrophin-3 n=1 Tax=Paramormyrops kingsleyae TaxID=1676925 RepID=A0A3B3SC12_9TELE|nr:neurotrophin-3-like isoform X2 [Paramormyrops kingsleyae]
MVTFITIIQVNLVMSILLYVMFLAYLCGIQAMSMDKRRPTPDPVNSLIIRLLQADIIRSQSVGETPGARAETASNGPWGSDYLGEAPAGRRVLGGDGYPERMALGFRNVPDLSEELLRQHKRHNSPRVVLSQRPPLQPPPMYLGDDYVSTAEMGNKTRRRRYTQHRSYRGEYSVCDSESQWVTDKTSAVDIRGRQVTVLGMIKTSGSDVKQYFYETKCKSSKPVKGGCRGIDDKHWNSQCKTSQTYVRALTSEKTSVSWNWIRIDTSCVCALSRKRRRT